MTKSNSTPITPASKPVRAALYFRMSRDQQEHSIERQKSTVIPHAEEKGYRVVETYSDEGIAGDETGANRPGFARMLADAQRGAFDVILCDDLDRFGRFDQITYGFIVEPLRKRGVTLRTVKDGLIDWVNSIPLLVESIKMGSRKEESATLSRRILTRFVVIAKEGKWPGGPPPYGYAVDPVTNKLVLGDPAHVRNVRWLFETYATRDVSLRWLANELTMRGQPTPSSRPRRKRKDIATSDEPNPKGRAQWSGPTIHAMFNNRNYTGSFHWNVRRYGKYQQVKNGQVVVKTEGRKKAIDTDEAEWIVVADSHPAIVDAETFDRVREKMASRQGRTTPKVGGGDLLLGGLLRCGHCGSNMVASFVHGKSRVYSCGKYALFGKKGKNPCNRNAIPEARITPAIVRKIQQEMLDPDKLARLREEVRRLASEERSGMPSEVGRIKRQIADLDEKIRKGSERLALVDVDMIEGISTALRGWRSERAVLVRDLDTASVGPDLTTAEQEVDRAEAYLWSLREALDRADPTELREVLRELVDSIELWWTHKPGKGGVHTRGTFVRGLIRLRSDDRLTCSKLVHSASAPSRP